MRKIRKSTKAVKSPIKQKTRQQLYQENNIATKRELVTIQVCTGTDLHGVEQFTTKKVHRVKYLKICWSCGSPYETSRINSFACSSGCRSNINYKLKNGYNPAVRMEQFTKVKMVNELKAKFGYR